MSNESKKKMEIVFSFHVSNGEWDANKKIERNSTFEHVIDLGLFNDENTFQAVMDTLKREFGGIEKSINTVMQRMIDGKPDAFYDADGNAIAELKEDKAKSNSGEPSDEQLSKMEMTRDEWNAQNLDNMLVSKSTDYEKVREEKAE